MTARVVDRRRSAAEPRRVEVLRAGGLVALPTDTVYGIGVALDAPRGHRAPVRGQAPTARPGDRAAARGADQAAEVGIPDAAARVLAAASWPGALTLVLPQRPGVTLPPILTGGASHDRRPRPRPPGTPRARGGRRPDAGDIGQRVRHADRPHGRGDRSRRSATAVDLVLDGGPARSERPSTVVDCSGERPRLLREGAIPAAALAAVLDEAELPHDLLPGR